MNRKIVTGASITDFNEFGKKEKVSIRDFKAGKVKNGKFKVSIPANSVVLVQMM